jgi:ADP-ribose pyrophosphatase YjhB (NUDIX family)
MQEQNRTQEGVAALPNDNGHGPAVPPNGAQPGAAPHEKQATPMGDMGASGSNGKSHKNGHNNASSGISSNGTAALQVDASRWAAGRRRLPCIDEAEVAALSGCYGEPLRTHVTLPVDDYTRPYRFGRKGDRRAEVVFAIEDPSGGIWVHAKAHYPGHIYRLPSGGVNWREGVESALLREIEEETALTVQVQSFLGLVDYCFLYEGQQAHFASYVFHVRSAGGVPCPHEGEAITGFRLAAASDMTELASHMRTLTGERSGWGQWRAISHELVQRTLGAPVAAPVAPQP